jgi:hypothetical protein
MKVRTVNMTPTEMHKEIGRILRAGSWRVMSTTWQQGEVFVEELRKAGFIIKRKPPSPTPEDREGASTSTEDA